MKDRWITVCLILTVSLVSALQPAFADGGSTLFNVLTDVAKRYVNSQSNGNYAGDSSARQYNNSSGDSNSSNYNRPPSSSLVDPSAFSAGGRNVNSSSVQLSPQSGAQGMGAAASSFVVALSRADLALLGAHNIVVMVDKSGSMGTVDCPAFGPAPSGLGSLFRQVTAFTGSEISRWDWCREQALNFSRQTAQVFGQGITVVPFSSDWREYRNSDINQVARVFSENRPDGGTNLGPALDHQLDSYFRMRGQSFGGSKPLVVAIISDGAPSGTHAVAKAIIEATKKMRNPAEVTVVFLQIGFDSDGIKFLQDVSGGLLDRGAHYRIVRIQGFDHLRQVGLGRALVEAVSSAPRAL
jgi:Mg-chelatase subunit ChlD